MRWLFHFVVLFGSFYSVFGWSLSFTSELFEKLETSEIHQKQIKLSAKVQVSSGELKDLLLLELFLAEAYEWRGKIHQSRAYYTRLKNRCDQLTVNYFAPFASNPAPNRDRSLAFLTCAILYAHSIKPHPFLGKVDYFRRIDLFLKGADSASPEDTLYARGRIFYALPPGQGQNIGRSLLAWRTLHHLKPTHSSPDFWMARIYQLQGNEDKARALFQKILKKDPPDSRALLLFPKREYVRIPYHLDGLSYGIGAGLYFSSAAGIGLRVRWFDDRLFDMNRSGSLQLGGDTGSHFGVATSWVDREWLAPTALALQGSVSYSSEDFYGLGIESPKDDRSKLTTLRSYLALSAENRFLHYFFIRAGWALHERSLRDIEGTSFSLTPLPQKYYDFHTGPFAEIGFDSRDSIAEPYRGYLVSLRTYFPTDGLINKYTFTQWKGQVRGYFPWYYRHRLSVHFLTSGLSGDAPYGAYPDFNGTFLIPGVRNERFQDRNLLVSFFQYRWRISQPISLIAFGTAGTVSTQWSDLFKTKWKGGFGGGIQLHKGLLRSNAFFLKVGYFAGEVVVKASASHTL